ncbi:hypothetical protein [Streptomyces sp. NBC_01304]|uniref:hypothetical protein n=1 Tax=Streptomyces sp. NBC_01304 TaxID=2903818 RepID=UPI002E13BF25|nr:hypothetical protein OG430_45020 [Streptomyces sp. NBC_01304]
MRTRTWFAGLAVGAALFAGGPVAAAQAAPAPSQTGTTSTVSGEGAAASASVPRTYTDVGTYRTKAACEADGRASVYSDWYCKRSSTTSNYHLWVNLDS